MERAKKYRSTHRSERYEAKVTMPAENKADFLALAAEHHLTISELLLGAVKEVYGIDFRAKK